VAVRTDSRTCVAIEDSTLHSDSPITLVLPLSPQTFTDVKISNISQQACPITQEIAPGVSSYELSLPTTANIPKLTPMIAIVGSSASSGFVVDNLNVQADLTQAHSKNTFRACGASDGVHLTVWQGVPITGGLLWTGHYYESDAPGNLPLCTSVEMSPAMPKS
jgi:hypothetical protein